MKGRKASVREIRAQLKDSPQLRREVFKRLCDHIKEGYSVESFGEISNESITNYMKTYPCEFIMEDFEAAMSQGRHMWESIGKAQAKGECLGNSRTWFYNMSQRYGWSERSKVETDNKHSVNVSVINYASKKPLTTTLEGISDTTQIV